MKVGIMSMQRIVNYGSFLQSYSLKKTIEELGHKVEFVDYEPGKILVENENRASEILLQTVKRKVRRIINMANKKQLENMRKAEQKAMEYDRKYKEEFLPLLGVRKERNIRPELDALVIGSDEVFNCLQTNPEVGYSKDLFGANSRAKKLLSYAASFGNTTKKNLYKYGIADEIAGYLKAFDHISVRDENSKNIVETLLDVPVEKHVDPVFLYDYTPLMQKKRVRKDYIAVYAYWSRITKEEAKAIERFARKNQKEILCLCAPQRNLENYVAANPFEILSYIRDADYVITDTFHGAVFSIKYNKNFSVFLRKGHEKVYGNSEKLYGLLSQFHLTGRIVTDLDSLEAIMKNKPDFDFINKTIEEEKEKSKAYLKRALEA